MEEQKNSKEVQMEVTKNLESNKQRVPEEKTEKLSYEELNQACMGLSQQNQQMQKYIQQLHGQMQQMNSALQTKRLDYLFKVVEIDTNASGTFDKRFVQKCTAEIQASLTIPEEKEESKKD